MRDAMWCAECQNDSHDYPDCPPLSDDLVTWLRAQLDDDERVALLADAHDWRYPVDGVIVDRDVDGWQSAPDAARIFSFLDPDRSDEAAHAVRHDPRRVLAEVDAKRRILGAHGRPHECIQLTGSGERSVVDGKPWELWEVEHSDDSPAHTCWTLRVLALPYADRPGYRPEWKP